MHVHVLADVVLAVLHDHHGAVVHVAHALADFLALLEHVDVEDLAGQDDRLDGIRQLVDVEHGHALQFGDAVEVVVIGQDRALELLAQHDQLVVHLAHALHIDVADAHQEIGQLLQLGQHFHAPAPALTAQAVRRVGDVLQFVEHEARDEQRARAGNRSGQCPPRGRR